MNKKICVSIIIALIMIVTLATNVLAANEDVTLVKVKDNVCTIKLGEDGEVIKQLISVDNEKKEVTLQIDVKNLKSKEEEKIQIECNFCNSKYVFTREELQEIVAKM